MTHNAYQPKVIRFPSFYDLTIERAADETGCFTKSEVEAIKLQKALATMRPFCNRSTEEIMEFVCYMFEIHGQPGQRICNPSEHNRNFYFVASGELILSRPTTQKKPSMERKLFELDCWGLECLFVGKDDRVTVTVTAPCRLFALTARRFMWLCKMSAGRTLRMQTLIVERLARELTSVQRYLDISPDSIVDSKPSTSKANDRLLNRLLHEIRQVELPTCRDAPQIRVTSGAAESIVIYGLTGCARLTQESWSNYSDAVTITVKAGDIFEIEASQTWAIQSGSNGPIYQTLLYLIRVRFERKSDNSVDQ